jgi:transposase-like protein
MSTGKHRDAGKERFWRRMVREWRASGLSVRAFCEQHEVRQASFYAWRRILAERDAEPKPFVQVGVLREEKAVDDGQASGLELRLPRDRVVGIDRGFDEQTLQRLLALLEEGRAC